MSISDQYITSIPSYQNALDLFKGEWSSKFPDDLGDLNAGHARLFDDARIEWAKQQFGGFEGKDILELGPLEGGHSYMLERYGAASVTAIEANSRAYLKCLITKEILGLQRVRFLCGDFIEFLQHNPKHFDICIASGVLYHMRNPIELIGLLSKVCNQVLIWTHYYDQDIISSNPNLNHKFPDSIQLAYGGFNCTAYRQEYGTALGWSGFCGGSAVYSYWMNREDILSCLQYFGFKTIQTHFESPEHQNGPSFALVATKDFQFSPDNNLPDTSKFDRTQKQLQEQLKQTNLKLKTCEQHLETAQNRIEAMQTSKFWKLRTLWFAFKKKVGLPADD